LPASVGYGFAFAAAASSSTESTITLGSKPSLARIALPILFASVSAFAMLLRQTALPLWMYVRTSVQPMLSISATSFVIDNQRLLMLMPRMRTIQVCT
jgi:hypothetical protein